MNSSLQDPQVANLLAALFNDARSPEQKSHAQATVELPADATPYEQYFAMKERYMPVDPQFGTLLYSLVRSTRARHIVEFGTSFGISTTYLAAGLRDSMRDDQYAREPKGNGCVITSEFIGEKIVRAKANLAQAGLESLVDFREGDALETLSPESSEFKLPNQIDLVFLDGAKNLYMGVLKAIEPNLRPGAIIASDNTDKESLAPFIEYLRDPANGYMTTTVITPDGDRKAYHEISIRL